MHTSQHPPGEPCSKNDPMAVDSLTNKLVHRTHDQSLKGETKHIPMYMASAR